MLSLGSTNSLTESTKFLFLLSVLLITDYVTGDISTSLALNKLNSGGTFFAGPYLDGSGVSNVTTQIGTHAYLPCKVSKSCQMDVIFYPTFLYSSAMFSKIRDSIQSAHDRKSCCPGMDLLTVRSFHHLIFSHYSPQVKQLGNKSVSWVRVRDDHILTVDRYAISPVAVILQIP